MSVEEEKSAHCQRPMENGTSESGEYSHRTFNRHAFASAMAASIISAVYGYGD